jgi:glutamyl-Q tRNA(Asp) synthetase
MKDVARQRQSPQRGRFAPSPTGPLHFGSLISAVGSYLQAKSQGGEWLVRIEDLDSPREIPGAADQILRTLEAFHLYWDGPVLYQSQRYEAYEEALNQLARSGHSFPCSCSRKSISESVSNTEVKTGPLGTIYPGTCRNGLPAGSTARAIRLRAEEKSVEFTDLAQGPMSTQLARDIGDFVIKRADNLYAYHLAVVVDDAYQGITQIVRGMDLLDATFPHLHLQDLLNMATPQYAHLPIAVNQQGEKLSKQTHAAPIDPAQAGLLLAKALSFLGHTPDPGVLYEDPEILLGWAVANWDLSRVPKISAIPADNH